MDIYKSFTQEQLITEIGECISLRAETENREKAAKAALLQLQMQTGEITVEHDGWTSTMTPEKMSASLIERHYGYPKKEIPLEVFTEQVSQVVDPDKAKRWLEEKGHDTKPIYSLTFRKKKFEIPKTHE